VLLLNHSVVLRYSSMRLRPSTLDSKQLRAEPGRIDLLARQVFGCPIQELLIVHSSIMPSRYEEVLFLGDANRKVYLSISRRVPGPGIGVGVGCANLTASRSAAPACGSPADRPPALEQVPQVQAHNHPIGAHLPVVSHRHESDERGASRSRARAVAPPWERAAVDGLSGGRRLDPTVPAAWTG